MGYEGQVWALGDCASIKTISGKVRARPPPNMPRAKPPPCATNIAAAIRGGQPALVSHSKGSARSGSLGHGSAVAQIIGVKISGMAGLDFCGAPCT